MPFSDQLGAQTHEERVQALASMTPNALGAQVMDMALSQDVVWLESMLKAGLFDAENVSNDMGHASTFLQTLHTTQLKVIAIEPEFSEWGGSKMGLVFKDKPGMKDFFERYVDQLVAQKSRIDQGTHALSTNPDEGAYGITELFAKSLTDEQVHAVQELFAKSFVLASALGMPETLHRLVTASPESAGISLPSSILGGGVSNFMLGHGNTFTPYVFAMQFSQPECMDVLLQSGRMDLNAIATTRKREKGSDTPLALDVFGAVGVTFSPLCQPSVFAKALRDRMAMGGAPEGHALQEHIGRLLQGDDLNRFVTPCLIAYDKEGLLNQEPTFTARMACIHGHGHLIAGLRGIDWAAEKGAVNAQPACLALAQLQVLTASRFQNDEANRERFEKSIAAYWNRAIADGHPEVVLQTRKRFQAEGEPIWIEPIQNLMEANFVAPVLAMFNAGLSVTQPLSPSLESPLQMAIARSQGDQGNDAFVSMMRSFSARSAAHDILNGMSLFSSPVKP